MAEKIGLTEPLHPDRRFPIGSSNCPMAHDRLRNGEMGLAEDRRPGRLRFTLRLRRGFFGGAAVAHTARGAGMPRGTKDLPSPVTPEALCQMLEM